MIFVRIFSIKGESPQFKEDSVFYPQILTFRMTIFFGIEWTVKKVLVQSLDTFTAVANWIKSVLKVTFKFTLLEMT